MTQALCFGLCGCFGFTLDTFLFVPCSTLSLGGFLLRLTLAIKFSLGAGPLFC